VTVLAPALVRTLVLAAMYVVALVVMDQSGETDPLGFGLLLFLLWVVVALVWGIVDGARHDAGRVLVAWLLVAAAIGVVLILGTVILEGNDGLDGAVGTVVFTVFLIGVPAAIGVGLGALVRKART
jgi:hypothetical protein